MKPTVFLLVVGMCLITIIASSSSLDPALATSPVNKARFTVICKFSHRAKDDPIVFPGQKGASHSHDFFANRSTSANSTYSGLRTARTTCNRDEDTAAYWLPTLYQDGRALTPESTKIYYSSLVDRAKVKAFPRNLRMITGDSKATSPQSTDIMSWACQGTDIDHRREPPDSCPGGKHLVLSMRFPNCWDGEHLDSADHKSHMAHSNRQPCPSTHPVRLPRIVMDTKYPTSKGTRLTFSSGSRYTGHADFINAWHQRELQRLVRRCIVDRTRTSDRLCNPPPN